jgi:hypothetical protein
MTKEPRSIRINGSNRLLFKKIAFGKYRASPLSDDHYIRTPIGSLMIEDWVSLKINRYRHNEGPAEPNAIA